MNWAPYHDSGGISEKHHPRVVINWAPYYDSGGISEKKIIPELSSTGPLIMTDDKFSRAYISHNLISNIVALVVSKGT